MTRKYLTIPFLVLLVAPFFTLAQYAPISQENGSLKLEKTGSPKPRNVIFILTDDHRYDAMGFLKSQTFIKTPNMDLLAQGGAYLPNAFVTTALCSPSRASILTGMYAHKHKVVDNINPVSKDIIFYSQYLQEIGYQTAMIGKWHIGGNFDDPQRGFDHWVSFRGQGSYLPNANGLNVDGKRVPQKGYITDELTDYAIDFLKNRNKTKPFMLYMAHKGVHSNFIPAERDKGKAANYSFVPPANMKPEVHTDAPMWLRNQRNSWHGVDFPYDSNLDIAEYYKRYAETLLSVDASIGKVVAFLKEQGLLESTLIIYMGDNGFQFGEHGLIDKRTAYEASMRVPMLVYCPELIKPGTVIKDVVANIDIAPTILEAAGLKAPAYMDGMSFYPLLEGKKPANWRTGLLYEYYWERNFPQTPTMYALRGDRYKYIYYTGIWDTDELYDLQTDPLEIKNLIRSQEHQNTVRQMSRQLFDIMKNTGGAYIPLFPTSGAQHNLRYEKGSGGADFPPYLKRQSTLDSKDAVGE